MTDSNVTMPICSTFQQLITTQTDNIVVGVALFIFFLSMFYFRYFAIFLPSLNRLKDEIDTLLDTLSNTLKRKKGEDQGFTKNIEDRIKSLSEKQKLMKEPGVWGMGLVSTGNIISGWRMLHDTKNTLAGNTENLVEELKIIRSRLVNIDTTEVKSIMKDIDKQIDNVEEKHLITLLQELHEDLIKLGNTDIGSILKGIENHFEGIKPKELSELLAVIDEHLSGEAKQITTNIKRLSKMHQEKQPSDATLKMLCKEGSRIYFEHRDNYFEMLSDWQNKVMWLSTVALLFIVLLLWLEPNAFLLVAGAIGGLLGKLRSIIQRPDTPNDYGFSWSTLFLSPLIGALTGWVGVYMIVIFNYMGLFGEGISKMISPITSCSSLALVMVAVLFGYSAKLFEKMIDNVEKYAVKEKRSIEVAKNKSDVTED